MTRCWRPLALTAALHVTAGLGAAAAAQTLFVRNAGPGTPVEVVVNGTKAGAGTADAGGDATVAFSLQAQTGKDEMDANVYVETCDKTRRVLIVDAGRAPGPAGSGCERAQISGLYWVRPVNTLVVDVGGVTPKLLLIKGHYTPPRPTPEGGEAHTWRLAPTGMVVYGAPGMASLRDAVTVSCGTVTSCSGKGTRISAAAGATYWITRYLGADVSYIKPAKVTASGSGTGYRFNSALDAELVTVAATVGVPAGPVRIYGKVGWSHHHATSATTETIDDVTVTVNDVPQTFKGGNQTFETETRGWGWLFGGGLEAWIKPSFAIYGEAGSAALKGSAVGAGEGQLNDRATLVLAGVRFRIGPK